MKSGSLNLLKPSGPVKACTGIALPFTVFYFYIDIFKKIRYFILRYLVNAFYYYFSV